MIINYLVVPRKSVPEELKTFLDLNQPVRQMLNGYRTKLTKSLRPILTSNLKYCGQAYRFKITTQTPDNILTYENGEQRIQKIQNNYVLVAKDQIQLFDPLTQKIEENHVKQLMREFGIEEDNEDQERVKNLLLNCFDSLREVQVCGLAFLLEKKHKQNKNSENSPDTTAYSGTNLFAVPQFDMKTGNWSKDHSYKLKIEIKKRNQDNKEKKSSDPDQPQIKQTEQKKEEGK